VEGVVGRFFGGDDPEAVKLRDFCRRGRIVLERSGGWEIGGAARETEARRKMEMRRRCSWLSR
jgi:hypothetical protein